MVISRPSITPRARLRVIPFGSLLVRPSPGLAICGPSTIGNPTGAMLLHKGGNIQTQRPPIHFTVAMWLSLLCPSPGYAEAMGARVNQIDGPAERASPDDWSPLSAAPERMTSTPTLFRVMSPRLLQNFHTTEHVETTGITG
ncbi:uncharacterized protein PG986_010360 [Apiospora aurea]|uniref:Uncharacterized protein n=1 Tax=Apiospora aurea TaxID=335848 RepID=A0ABR1Q230_9PEZI